MIDFTLLWQIYQNQLVVFNSSCLATLAGEVANAKQTNI